MTVDRLIRDCWFANAVPAEHWLSNALGSWREIAARLRGWRFALFLDYDGTLAAIASRPSLLGPLQQRTSKRDCRNPASMSAA